MILWGRWALTVIGTVGEETPHDSARHDCPALLAPGTPVIVATVGYAKGERSGKSKSKGSDTMERYAVDFGTSNTVVARWNFCQGGAADHELPGHHRAGERRHAASHSLRPLLPGEESFLMGYEVTSRGLDDIRSSRYFWGFKRGLLHLTSLYEDRGREFPPTISRGCISPGCWAIWS